MIYYEPMYVNRSTLPKKSPYLITRSLDDHPNGIVDIALPTQGRRLPK